MTPRQEWLKHRVDECLKQLEKLNKLDDRKEFIREALVTAYELLYATSEWEKYYDEKT